MQRRPNRCVSSSGVILTNQSVGSSGDFYHDFLVGVPVSAYVPLYVPRRRGVLEFQKKSAIVRQSTNKYAQMRLKL